MVVAFTVAIKRGYILAISKPSFIKAASSFATTNQLSYCLLLRKDYSSANDEIILAYQSVCENHQIYDPSILSFYEFEFSLFVLSLHPCFHQNHPHRFPLLSHPCIQCHHIQLLQYLLLLHRSTTNHNLHLFLIFLLYFEALPFSLT